MNLPYPKFLPRLIVKSDCKKRRDIRETLDRIDECINEDKESERNSINLSSPSSFKAMDAEVFTHSSRPPSISNIFCPLFHLHFPSSRSDRLRQSASSILSAVSMPFYTSTTLPRNIGRSSDVSSAVPFSFSHQFTTLHRPSHQKEETSSRLSYEEPPSFFSYPMQIQPSIMQPQQSQQMMTYPHPNQMIQSMGSFSQTPFIPQIPYNQSVFQQSAEPQQMCPSSSLPSYPMNPPQVVYFSPYTNPPAAFLPNKQESYSEDDYDSFPSDCLSLCCHGFAQLLWMVVLILFCFIIGAFCLGLFSL